MTAAERQAIVDGEHLRLLSICYIIYGAFNAFFSLFGLLYAFMGLFITSFASQVAPQPNQPAPPEFIGLFFGAFGVFTFVVLLRPSVVGMFDASATAARAVPSGGGA
jgi:hypothetical protein